MPGVSWGVRPLRQQVADIMDGIAEMAARLMSIATQDRDITPSAEDIWSVWDSLRVLWRQIIRDVRQQQE